MFCSECGGEIPEGDSFCSKCGTPIEAEASQPPAPEPPGAPVPAPPPAVPPAMPPAAPPMQAAGPPPALPTPVPAAKKSGKGPIVLIAAIGILLVIVAVVLVLVFTVFKSDTGKAKTLVKSGDKYMEAMQAEADAGAEALDELLTSKIENIATAAEFKEEADVIREAIDAAQEELKSAEGEYKQVGGLKGVEKYKEYAKTVLELIALDYKIQDTTNEYLDYIEGQYEAADAGQPVSVEEIQQTSTEYIDNVTSMGEEATELREKADKLRSDNKLN
ncbi:MAG: zinc ribbon domain-containing protein [Actinobacteria bacterium]|nr:zinc ribbon domain-containing protein [Actinomycetota bacterium]MBU1944064.1 zinc ribbon domain-containing protein [Actinomycetota bacterium]MBU2687224.1 zinc ribbon domain-containing protein [Actinomycetota bacterium]